MSRPVGPGGARGSDLGGGIADRTRPDLLARRWIDRDKLVVPAIQVAIVAAQQLGVAGEGRGLVGPNAQLGDGVGTDLSLTTATTGS